MNPYFERYLRNRYAASGGMGEPGWQGTQGGVPGSYGGYPLYIYQCRHYSPEEARQYCYFTVAPGSQFAFMRPECNTIVGGPFRTMQEADAHIQRSYSIGRGETFSC